MVKQRAPLYYYLYYHQHALEISVCVR